MLTKEAIIQMLKTDKRAVARALVVLYNRQTNDEQAQEGTRHLNGRGFRPCHARMGSSMAKQFIKLKFLSEKQINYWRVLDRQGNMRIGIYAGQLLEEAELKAQQKNPVLDTSAYKESLPEIRLHDFGHRGVPGHGRMMDIVQNHLYGHSVPATEHWQTTDRDYGNDMERKMVLEEIHGDAVDSDDPAILAPIEAELREIDEFWKKIRNKM